MGFDGHWMALTNEYSYSNCATVSIMRHSVDSGNSRTFGNSPVGNSKQRQCQCDINQFEANKPWLVVKVNSLQVL